MKSMTLATRPEILAIGWMANGSPIYQIWGCDPGDGTTEETPAGGSSGEGGTSTEGVAPLEDPAAATAAVTDPTELARTIETLTRRLNAADNAKGAAEKALRAYEDQGKSDLERAQNQVKELSEQLVAAREDATRAKLEREILKHPGYVWHDPEVALALIDTTGVEFDEETGKVRGVADALKKLAASKPFLLKGKASEGGGNSNGSGGGRPAGPSGTKIGDGTPDEAAKKREALVKKYRL